MVHQLSFIDGITERDRIIAAFRENHHGYTSTLTELAVAIAGEKGTVTIDDVREKMLAIEFPFPGDLDIDERVFGAIFPRKRFKAVDVVKSRRVEHVKRSGIARSGVTVYRLKDAA